MSVICRRKDNIAFVKVTGHVNDQKCVDQYIEFMESVYNMNTKFVVLFDLSESTGIPWPLVLKQVSFMRSHRPLTLKYMMGAGIYLKPGIIQTIVHNIFKICPPATNVGVFQSLEETKAFIIKAREEGVTFADKNKQ